MTPDTLKFQPSFQIREDAVYTIENFDELYDRRFVAALYLAMLRREPDAAGEAHYLGLLRAGEYKARLVHIFLTSEEGRRHNTTVRGLDARLRWIRALEFPVIGRLLAALLFLLNVREHMRDLRILENHVIRTAEETQRANEMNLRRLRQPPR